MRRVAALGALIGLTGLLVVLTATPAAACSCSPPPPFPELVEREFDAAESTDGVFFIGEQVAGDGPTYTFRVDRVLAGNWTDDTIVATSSQDTCGGGSYAGHGLLAFRTWDDPDEGIRSIAHGCGPPYDAERVLAVIDGLPDPPGKGAPAFVVGHQLGSSHLAVLDDAGQVLAYAFDGLGEPQEIRVCPGAETALVAVVSRTDTGEPRPIVIERRSLPELELLGTIDAEVVTDYLSWQSPVLSELRCHDAGAGTVTFLETSLVNDMEAGIDVRGHGVLVMVEPAGITRHDIGVARAVDVDWTTRTAWAITGEGGQTLTTLDLDTGVMGGRPLPGSHVGWALDVLPDGGLRILASSSPLERADVYWSRIDSQLVGAPNRLAATTLNIPPSAVVSVEANGAGLGAFLWGEDGVQRFSLIGLDGDVETIDLGHETGAMAVGRDAIIAPSRIPSAYASFVSNTSGERRPLEGVAFVRVARALGDGDGISFDGAPPIVPPESTPTGRPRPASPTIADITDGVESADPSAETVAIEFVAPSGGSGGVGTRAIAAVGTATGGVALGAVLLLKRRRT